MGLFDTMRTSVAGMNAQSNALGTIGDNIANSSTTGYKEAGTQFETVLGQNVTSDYVSGGVQTVVRTNVSNQGTLQTTTSATDLAIKGNGFFVVSNGGQGTFLTRAGSFIPDSNGNLVNAAGFQLMGYQVTGNTAGTTLMPVNIPTGGLQAAASTSGTLTANLPSTATTVTGNTPSSNSSSSTYTDKTSLTVYDNLGTTDVVDVYMTKTGDNQWEVTAYPQSDAASGGGFPYSNGSTPYKPMGTATLTFDPTTGKLSSANPASPTSISLNVPNGNKVNVDLSNMTQLATSFGVTTATADGNAPSRFDHVNIAADGTVTTVYASGAQVNSYEIPLATVTSPDNLTPETGNVWQVSTTSGDMVLSAPGTGGAGSIVPDALEQSTVDLATELTNMIQAQRAYEANSKVLQTGSDMLSVLNRLTTN